MEVSEEHKVFSAKTMLFQSKDDAAAQRRTLSLGPGTIFNPGVEDELPETPDERRGRRRSAFFIQPDHPPEHSTYLRELDDSPAPSRNGSMARDVSRSVDTRDASRPSSSTNSPLLQRTPSSSDEPPLYHDVPSSPSPQFERPNLTPSHSARQLEYLATVHENPALALQESREHLRADLDNFNSRRNSYNANSQPPSSSASSIRSFSNSRRPSIDEIHEEPISATPRPSSHMPQRAPSTGADSPDAPRSRSRGRSRGRFSFTSIGSSLLDAVRSSRSRDTKDAPGSPSMPTRIKEASSPRGRQMDRPAVSPGLDGAREEIALYAGMSTEDGSKEFKKGTYKYPISFTIPGHAPPTLATNYGTVTWFVKATAHRPGTFTSKLTAQHPVVVVACPTEEDTEDTENIIVERHWDNQLQYLISISGKSFYVGGTIPVTFTLLPLAKVKIHRLMIYLEEKIDYHLNFGRQVARSEPLHRTLLLSARDETKASPHILPLESDSVDVLRTSPLATFIPTHSDDIESEMSEMASNLLGPGPWTLHKELQLPRNCRALHFTNKNRRTNMTVSHTLKCVIRVEKDDSELDELTGKRKLFDIVVQMPVHILSCRCNPEWTWLPHYSDINDGDDSMDAVLKCPCLSKPDSQPHHHAHPTPPISRPPSTHSDSDSSAMTVETRDVNPDNMRSLRSDYTPPVDVQTYQQLVSGQLTESGEAPPAYKV